MDKRQIRRRQFLKMSATAVVGAVAAACGAQGTPVVIKETVPVKETVQVTVKETVPVVVKETQVVPVTVEVPKKMAEPPLLKPLVDAGKLPPSRNGCRITRWWSAAARPSASTAANCA